jgi:predicted nucleotidyltransferase
VDDGLIASYLRSSPEERLRAFGSSHLLRTLTAHGVDFVVVGGIAARLLGSARDTSDFDICPAVDEPNLDSLGKALAELEAQPRIAEGTVETAAGPLDIHMRPNGSPPYEQLRRRAERKDLGSFSVLVASIEDLIAMKEASGRRKDLVVVEELEAIRRLRRRLGIRD